MKKVNLISLDRNIIENVYVKKSYSLSVLYNLEFVSLELVYNDFGNLKGIIINNKNDEIVLGLLNNKEIVKTIPTTLKEYRKLEDSKEIKVSKIAFSRGTGNSSKNSYSTSLYIPASWLSELGINKENNKVVMEFNGNEIIIRSINQRWFLSNKTTFFIL